MRADGSDRRADPVCPLCSAPAALWASTKDVEYRTSDDTWAYARCPACATIFLPDPPVGRLAEIYPADYYSYATTRALAFRGKEWLDRRTLKAVCAKVRGTDLRVLDVGGGAGAMASLARRVEPRVRKTVVVDFDDGAAAKAEAAGHRFVASRIEDYEAEAPFDVVLLLNLIEHTADPTAVLAGVRRLTSPGGIVLVKTPNVEGLDARVLRNHDWGGYHAPRHWTLFSPETFRRVAERAGFVVERLTLTQGGPFWTVGVISTLERWHVLRRATGRAMVSRKIYGPLVMVFAAFDLVRARLGGKTSQMFVELRPRR